MTTNDRNLPLPWIVGALLLALGLLGAGWFASRGLVAIKTQDRYVTVKGSAERIVDADLLVWPLPHTVGGNDLAEVQRRLAANTDTIRRFFLDAGFEDAEIVVSPPRLEDRWAYAYGDSRPPERFRYSNTVSLRTTKVDKALAALRNSGQLVGEGVMIDQGSQPDFDYTKLNDIKPALIAEATAAARESAVQFAKDSGSKLGGIRNANQGVVTISDRDQSSPQVKKVRVVTTVEYFLRD
jgi:hypothetical protein